MTQTYSRPEDVSLPSIELANYAVLRACNGDRAN